MLVLWMGYTVLLGAVVVGAAALLERGVPSRRRWLWAGAQLMVVALPLVRPVLRRLGGGSGSLDVVFGPVAPVVRGALPDLGALGAAVAASPTLADLRGPVVGIWIGASLVLLVLVLGGMLRTRRLRRTWRAHVIDGSEVLVSDDLGPAVVGVRRPAIVLPTWVLELAPAERSLILAHEDEHRRSGDPALLAAALAVPVLMPWNPAAWLAFARLREAVETDCDQRVLAHRGREPLHYARLLFDVSTRSTAAVPLGAGFGERASTLERRMRAMLGAKLTFGWRGLAARLAVVAVLLTAACSLEVNIYADGSKKDEADATLTTDARSPEPAFRTDATAGAKKEVMIPPKPPVIARPKPEEERGAPPKEEISAGPMFTPFTVAPSITNREEVIRAMEKEYPPLLRDAGIGGTVKVYFFIDETGRVQDVRIDQSSGHQALDEAALKVANIYRFSPALNRDQKVPVWVSFPITFQVR
jgi:TonB family protein